MDRRNMLAALCAMAGATVAPHAAWADPTYPQKPVRLLVGVAPGGAADTLGRIFAQRVGEALGQSIIVDNKAGASGTIAAEAAAKSSPDGYTLVATSPTVMVVAPYLYRQLGFVPQRDLEPVVLIGGGPLGVLVNTNVPARSLRELIGLAKARPGTLAFGSGGNGTASHLSAEMLASQASIELLHSPYKGEGQALTDLLGGQVQMQITALNLADAHIKSGRLRLLAVTSKTRMPSYPDVPTVDESGLPGYESLGWIGLYAPAKTPPAIVQRLAAEWRKARAIPEVAKLFDSTGMGYIPSGTPEEFLAFQKSEVLRWEKVLQKANLKPE
jgi:tripartite-type tricarboxylate transporter receptor subunit TctC